MTLAILEYGDCTSLDGQITENVGFERLHCTSAYMCASVGIQGAVTQCDGVWNHRGLY